MKGQLNIYRIILPRCLFAGVNKTKTCFDLCWLFSWKHPFHCRKIYHTPHFPYSKSALSILISLSLSGRTSVKRRHWPWWFRSNVLGSLRNRRKTFHNPHFLPHSSFPIQHILTLVIYFRLSPANWSRRDKSQATIERTMGDEHADRATLHRQLVNISWSVWHFLFWSRDVFRYFEFFTLLQPDHIRWISLQSLSSSSMSCTSFIGSVSIWSLRNLSSYRCDPSMYTFTKGICQTNFWERERKNNKLPARVFDSQPAF